MGSTADALAGLPRWQQWATTIVGVTWYLNQLDHPWLFGLYGHLAMLARLAPHWGVRQ
jgi:hypothetical protein